MRQTCVQGTGCATSGNSNTAVTSRVWTGTNNNGTTDSFNYLGGFSPAFGTSNSPTTPLKQGITTTGNYRLYGLSQVFVVDADRTTPATTDISIISNPGIGDTYCLGETVEVEVTYSEAVSVRGTPSVGLAVRSATEESDNEYEAAYVRGSGTTKLVFSFTVPAGLKDDDGIQLHSSALRLNGGTITAVSDGIAAVWNLAAERNIGAKVDSSGNALTGGICDRTPPVRYAIVAAVTAASDCSQVTEEHLAALTGTLTVNGLTSVAAGDFAGLSGITGLTLTGSGIETLPAGLLDAGGQGRSEGGCGCDPDTDLRGGVSWLQLRVPTGAGGARCARCPGLRDRTAQGQLDSRCRPPGVLRHDPAGWVDHVPSRHYPDDFQVCGDHTPVPPSRELYSLCSHPMA